MSKEERETAHAEWVALDAIGTAPDYLAQKAYEWAKLAPDDPRVPEALHYAIRSTRYGCDEKDTSRWSKEVFKLLHSRYPDSKWTKETPYWF